MKRLLATLSLLTVGSSVQAHCESDDYAFYIKVDSGVSCSSSVNIVAPSPTWNEAVQGYNATLGNRPIIGLSVGCELFDVVDLEFNISNRSTFTYTKFQTPLIGGDSYTRRFNLDVTSVLFSVNFLGRGISHCNWDIRCGQLYPLIGFGIGASDLLITNFRTTGLPPTGDSFPHASFSSENQYTLHRNFTYTLRAGFEYNYKGDWAIATGYRWFNAGDFEGPQFLRVASGAAVDVGCDVWDMRFRANEWFIEFKIFI